MSQHDSDTLLQEKIDVFDRQIQPQRDLWPGIDLALEEQLQQPPVARYWYGIAASVAALCIFTLLSLNNIHQAEPLGSEINQIISLLNQQHERQKQFLLSSYEQQPALTNNWQTQLQELDDAATTIKVALKNDPADANLIGMLQQVYQQQIKLIQSVHQPRWM
ncbi:MAG: hypothetical protein GKR93_09255 [Gammaproteobacteria bacterium]|nr:hypothetical protein [Gammaproteobacteria bacterium]